MQECMTHYIRSSLQGLRVRTSLYPWKGFGTFFLNVYCKSWKLVEVHYKFHRELFHPRTKRSIFKPEHLWGKKKKNTDITSVQKKKKNQCRDSLSF